MQRTILCPLNSFYRAFQKKNVIIFPCRPYSISYVVHRNSCKSPYFLHDVYFPRMSVFQKRKITLSSNRLSEKTKVEESVKVLKEEHEKKKTDQKDLTSSTPGTTVSVTPQKRSLGKKILDEIVHYYNGFRLLFVDIKISCWLVVKIIKGQELSRRENRLLVRTVSDIFRLVPFSIFIIVPFMELFLPIFVKFFPSLLPSTFESASDKKKKFKAQLKLKIEMAKFLQDTLDELALHSKGETHSQSAKEFAIFFEKIRTSGTRPTNAEILKFSKLFEDELTLDNLPRPSLIALCRLLELHPIGTNNLLRFQLRMRLRTLKADDQLIKNEGIDSLSVPELQAACRARGMRALGVPEDRLKAQLKSWLELSLAEQIPASLLLLSRALYLPENLDATDQLKATLSSLPDTATTEAKFKIGEMEGKVDNKTKLELVKNEVAAIKEETEEMVQEKLEKLKETSAEAAKIEAVTEDIIMDKAPVIEDKAPTLKADEADKKELSKEDFDELEDAIENISEEKKALLIEKEEISELKEEMADYKEDIEELKGTVLETGHEEISESKAALRLSKRVDKMISKMDILLDELAKETNNLQQQIDDKDKEGISASKEKSDIISINELVSAIRRIQKVSDDTRLQRIVDVLEKMDVDHDGAVKIDHVLKVIELLGKDNVKVTAKQMDEIIELLMKEDNLELEEKTQKQQVENVSQEKTGK